MRQVTVPADPAFDDTGGQWQIGVAEGGWWTAERAKLLAAELAPVLPRHGVCVDLGCGRGEAVELLSTMTEALVVGVDFEALPQWRSDGRRFNFVVADLRRLPFRAHVADFVGSFDVIEHFADDADPLASTRELVRDDGLVALTVPATPGLWSVFDERVGHHRRYTGATLEAAVQNAGLAPGRSTYFFSWLVPILWGTRRRDRSGSDALPSGFVGRVVTAVIRTLCRMERAVLRRARLPFGSSLFMLCRPLGAKSDGR